MCPDTCWWSTCSGTASAGSAGGPCMAVLSGRHAALTPPRGAIHRRLLDFFLPLRWFSCSWFFAAQLKWGGDFVYWYVWMSSLLYKTLIKEKRTIFSLGPHYRCKQIQKNRKLVLKTKKKNPRTQWTWVFLKTSVIRVGEKAENQRKTREKPKLPENQGVRLLRLDFWAKKKKGSQASGHLRKLDIYRRYICMPLW
jgi:hypothetical protein